jgi:hypothetical protein
MFAALCMEEVIAHVRSRQPAFEIIEPKVLGKQQVLSCSEHLETLLWKVFRFRMVMSERVMPSAQ